MASDLNRFRNHSLTRKHLTNSTTHIKLLTVFGTAILLSCRIAFADAGTAAPAGSALSTNTNSIPSNSSPRKGPTVLPPTNNAFPPPISPSLNASNHSNLAPPFNPNLTSPARALPPVDPNAPGPGTKPDDLNPRGQTNGIGGTNGFFREPRRRNKPNTNGFFRRTETNGLPLVAPIGATPPATPATP